jgi:hypothetical protein
MGFFPRLQWLQLSPKANDVPAPDAGSTARENVLETEQQLSPFRLAAVISSAAI